MRELNEKEIESVSGALAQDAAPPKQNTEAIQSAQNKSTLTPFILKDGRRIIADFDVTVRAVGHPGSNCQTTTGGGRQLERCRD